MLRPLAVVILSIATCAIACASSASALAEDNPSSSTSSTTVKNGWYPYGSDTPIGTFTDTDPFASSDVAATTDPDTGTSATPNAISPDASHSPGTVLDCPASITNYSGAKSIYNCEEMVVDFLNHPVKVRLGRSNPSGFGYLHAYVDHHVNYSMIEGILAHDRTTVTHYANHRYLYGITDYFDGEPEASLELHEDRDTSSDAPDHYELGLLTAFCRVSTSSSPEEKYCPEEVIEQF